MNALATAAQPIGLGDQPQPVAAAAADSFVGAETLRLFPTENPPDRRGPTCCIFAVSVTASAAATAATATPTTTPTSTIRVSDRPNGPRAAHPHNTTRP